MIESLNWKLHITIATLWLHNDVRQIVPTESMIILILETYKWQILPANFLWNLLWIWEKLLWQSKRFFSTAGSIVDTEYFIQSPQRNSNWVVCPSKPQFIHLDNFLIDCIPDVLHHQLKFAIIEVLFIFVTQRYRLWLVSSVKNWVGCNALVVIVFNDPGCFSQIMGLVLSTITMTLPSRSFISTLMDSVQSRYPNVHPVTLTRSYC